MRERAKLLVGVAVAGLLSGVGLLLFGSGGDALSGPIAQAAILSSSAAGYRMHATIEMTSPSLSSGFTMTLDGVVDTRDRAASLSMTMTGASGLAQQFGVGPMQMQMITRGSTAYIKLPSLATNPAQPWIRVDPASFSKMPGTAGLAINPTTASASSIVGMLRSLSGDVRDAGPEIVDGVQTTHYVAEINIDNLAASLPPSAQTTVQRVLPRLEQLLPSHDIPVDVWIDGQHHVRRATMSLQLAIPGGPSLQVAATADTTDYGPQAPPALPPANQVEDLSNALP